MKIAIKPEEAHCLKQFLDQLDKFQFDKKLKKSVRVVHNSIKVDLDCSTILIDSWRFREALPFIKWAFNQSQVGFNKSYGAAKIAWWKWLLLPLALWEYLFKMVPYVRAKRAEANHIAAAVTQIDEAIVRSAK